MSSALPSYGNRTPEQLKVAELREELKRRGIQCKGLKKELVERLEEAVQKELQEQRNAQLAALEAKPDDEEPEPETDVQPVPSHPPVNDVCPEPKSVVSDVEGPGTLPPDLNLAPKEDQFEPKEPLSVAIQPKESETKIVEHAVEPVTLPDSIPKVNSVPSPYPAGIEVALHESLSEVPEVANSDANAEHRTEVKIGTKEDHVPEVTGEPKPVEDHAVEEPKSETVYDPAVGFTDEGLQSPHAGVTEPLSKAEDVEEVRSEVMEVCVHGVVEGVQLKAEEKVEVKFATDENVQLQADDGSALDGSTSVQDEMIAEAAVQVDADGKHSESEVGVVVETMKPTTEEEQSRKDEAVEELVETAVMVSETNLEEEKTQDDAKAIHASAEEAAAGQDEHMVDAAGHLSAAAVVSAEESAAPSGTAVEMEETVPTESLLPGVIPGEPAVLSSGFGKGSSESDEPRDLEEGDRHAALKVAKDGRTVEADKSKFDDSRTDRRQERGRREPVGRNNDDRHRYEKDQRREVEDRHRYDKDRRDSTGRRDDVKLRYDDTRREPLAANQKAEDERQRARRRESSRAEVRHTKEGQREREDSLDGRSRVFASTEEQRGKGQAEVEDNGKGKDFRPMDIDSDALAGSKRKEGDLDARQLEPTKRQRRWNSGKDLVGEDSKATSKVLTAEVLKDIAPSEARDSHSALPSVSAPTPTGIASAKANTVAERATAPRSVQRGLKADISVNGESAKQRIVPPPTRSPTTSLKIDRFLRPFTFKAVKDLLSQTGTVKDIWMDHIKTHCFVTYSSVEEAVATRDAVYNLQWPVHVGKLLVAEFVEPEEVKLRSEGSSEKSGITPVTTPRGSTANSGPMGALGIPPVNHPQSTNANATVAVHPPSGLTPSRDKATLPPKREPEPVPTLDDLFKKTKAKPQIYYLPLTEDQAAAKINVASNQPMSKPPVRV